MNILNKIIIVILLIVLFGCSVNKEYEYIEPIRENSYFSLLNDPLKNDLYDINLNVELDNYQLSIIGKDLSDISFEDIDGNSYNLLDLNKTIIEIVSLNCSYCLKQIKYNNHAIINNKDYRFLEFFTNGDKENILDFYNEINEDVPKNTIIPKNPNLIACFSDLGVLFTPSFLFVDKGKVCFLKENVTNDIQLFKIADYVFNNELSKDYLVTNDGTSIFDIPFRTIEDIKKDISGLDIKRLEDIEDNPLLTYSIISRKVDYTALEGDLNYSMITNFRPYIKTDTVILFYNLNENSISSIELIKKLISSHKELSFIVIINDDNNILKEYKEIIDFKYNTSLGLIPIALKDISFTDHLGCVFVEKGTITGGLTNIDSLDYFNKTMDLFLGDRAIAHIKG